MNQQTNKKKVEVRTMAGKKDFSTVNTGRVYDAIAEATAEPEQEQQQAERKPRREYTDAEKAAYMQAGATKGRKGCKMVRINMAFTPEVHAYIKTMARVRGESITDFTNYIFTRSMEDNAEIYEKAKAFRDSI